MWLAQLTRTIFDPCAVDERGGPDMAPFQLCAQQ